jgi:hypothetical protein
VYALALVALLWGGLFAEDGSMDVVPKEDILIVPFWSPVPLWYHFLYPSILFQKNLRAI